MKFLLDSCISFFAVKDLREEKCEVIWIPETGKDPGIEQGAIITVDKYRVRIRYIYE